MHKVTIYLKQHTPILHFQGDYAMQGATLRATELKPKLDRFISANYPVSQEWRIGKTNALNYKLRVSGGFGKTATCSTLPMYFAEPKKRPTDTDYSKKPILANIKSEEIGQEKVLRYSSRLEFFCLNKDLANLLKNLDYTAFFLSTNFGTRQSKGYGSFFPADVSAPTNLLGHSITVERDATYRIDSYFSPDFGEIAITWEDILDCVSDVYKCLRSGINENGLYFKSLLFAYAKEHGEWWDKRLIKELFFPNELEEHRKEHPGRRNPDPLAESPMVSTTELYPMFRDNLGLATNEDWHDYNMKITKKGNGITRFKSPILFKPICIDGRWFVFILHREIPRRFRNTVFSVIVNDIDKQGKKTILIKKGSFKSKTSTGFSMSDYMDFVWGLDNFEQFAQADGEDAEDRKNGILNDLDEIKENYIRIKQS